MEVKIMENGIIAKKGEYTNVNINIKKYLEDYPGVKHLDAGVFNRNVNGKHHKYTEDEMMLNYAEIMSTSKSHSYRSEDKFKKLCIAINHESVHIALREIGEREASLDFDNICNNLVDYGV